MLDDVERRRLLVQPAGEDAAIAVLRIARLLDVELYERPGEPLRLPGGGRLAGAQPHDRVADPHRLARLQRQILRQAVALVEEAEHRDALAHRRRAGDLGGHRLRYVDSLRAAISARAALAAAALAARGKGEHGREGEDERPRRAPHPCSGVQAS